VKKGRRTAAEKEMRNAEECMSCCGEKGANSDVWSVSFIDCFIMAAVTGYAG
jgi:hypothetical protein